MTTINSTSKRKWWIIGCMAALLIAGVCCGVVVVAGGGIFTWIAPQVQATLTQMTAEAQPYNPRVTDLAPALPPPPGPTPTPPPATNFTNNEGRSEYAAAAMDGQGNLHVIWFDDSLRSDNSGRGDILHRQLSADGQWSDVENLSSGFEEVINGSPQLLSASDGRVCAFWNGREMQGISDSVYWRCWSNGQWGELEKQDSEEYIYENSPAFAPDGTLEIAVSSSGEWRLHDQRVIPSPDSVYNFKFVIDAQGVYHILWEQGEPNAIWHRSSKDQGQTWSDAEQASDTDQSPWSGTSGLQVACDSQGNLHLLWAGQNGAYYRLWKADGGWQAAEKILAQNQFMGGAALAVDSAGLPHVAFNMIINGPPSVGYIARQADGKWTSPSLVAFTGRDEAIGSGTLVLVVDPQGRKHFIWPVMRLGGQGASNTELYYAMLP
jgi:hypothetical protein